MRVNARLDAQAAEQIDYLTRTTGHAVSHVLRESVAHYYAHVRAGRGGPARLLALLGKGDSSKAGPADGSIASDVKRHVGDALDAKHRAPRSGHGAP